MKKGLLFDCNLDHITVYDGDSNESTKLLQFCGSGHLPRLTSTNNQFMVTLFSSSNNVLYDARFEFNIDIDLIAINSETNSIRRANVCDYSFDGTTIRRGLIQSIQSTIGTNTSCNYLFYSSNIYDKIWLQFISYFADDSNPWSSEEKCDSTKLEIIEPSNGQSNRISSQLLMNFKKSNISTFIRANVNNGNFILTDRFCEKNQPKICGRIYNSTSLPNVPCSYPKESYLSKSSSLSIIHVNSKSISGIYSMPSHFKVIFEFIDTHESGDAIMGTLCDRRFASNIYSSGLIRSSRNVFYYGRGGNSNLSCSYYFHGKASERLQISIHLLKLKSSKCSQHYSNLQNIHKCRIHNKEINSKVNWKNVRNESVSSASSSLLSTLIVYDSVSSELFNVACFCDSTSWITSKKPIILNLIGGDAVLNFTVTNMNPFQDFNDFAFEATFAFIDDNRCSSNRIETKSDQGEIAYTVPYHISHFNRNGYEFKCRWMFLWFPNKYLSMKFNGYKPER